MLTRSIWTCEYVDYEHDQKDDTLSKVKVQIMLPEEMVSQIEDDCKYRFMKKSLWFERVIHLYFKERIEKKDGKDTKKKIELDI